MVGSKGTEGTDSARKAARHAARHARPIRARKIKRERPVGSGQLLRVALSLLLAVSMLPLIALPQSVYADDPAGAPLIMLQPEDSTYAKGATTRYYVNANSPDGGYLTYQWHISQLYDTPPAGVGQGNPTVDNAVKATESGAITGANGTDTQATLTATSPTTAGYYYLWVTITNHRDGYTDTSRDSVLALARIVDRTLEPKLMNGDFQTYNLASPFATGTGYWVNVPAMVANTQIPYWNTTHQNKTLEPQRTGVNGVGAYLQTAGHAETAESVILPISESWARTQAIHLELSATQKSSIYQDIATTPGKIYEWSLDFAGRSDLSVTEMIAVIIGPSLNAQSDYGAGITNHWVGSGTLDSATLFAYGQNTTTFFQDIANAAGVPLNATQAGVDNDTWRQQHNGDLYIVPYNGSTYYVKLVSDVGATAANGKTAVENRAEWTHATGVYTVPAGQGTSVFGFVSIYASAPNLGSLLDNISFKSGSPVSTGSDINYTAETQLTATTKAGFAYALVEVRGSTPTLPSSLNAFYSPTSDPAGALPITEPVPPLGSGGWYTQDNGGSPFVTGGTLVFKNLTPGKTYRVIGIPIDAISTGLNTNISPASVLDEGYYTDSRIKPSALGGTAQLPPYQMELYTSDGNPKVRLTLENTRSDVEYALMPELGDKSGPDTSTAAPYPAPVWKGGGGDVVFENLTPSASAAAGDTVTYYLVARAYGYTEVTIADAAYLDDGTLAALGVPMLAIGQTDVPAANVTRPATGTDDGTKIRLSPSVSGYEYALADMATGTFEGGVGGIKPGGTALEFAGLDPTKAYQLVCKPTTASVWSTGVLVYPPPTELDVQWTSDTIAGSGGVIAGDIEFQIQADNGNWLAVNGVAGNASTWLPASGTQALSLSDSLAGEGATGTGLSIFGQLDTWPAVSTATLNYRLAAGFDGFTGPAVYPMRSLDFPKQGDGPSVGTANTYDVYVNYPAEALTDTKVDTVRLQYLAPGTSVWVDMVLDGNMPFVGTGTSGLGWNGAAARTLEVRTAAIDGSAFATKGSAVTILARDPAPVEPRVVLVDPLDSSQGIRITNLTPGTLYEHQRSVSGPWGHTVHESVAGSDNNQGTETPTLTYGTTGGDYNVRYPATTTAPASFYMTVSTPLSIVPINFNRDASNNPVTLKYGDTITGRAVTVNNIIGTAVTMNNLNQDGGAYFSLPAPADKVVPPSGSNTNYILTPAGDIPAGSYIVGLEVTYTLDGTGYFASANAYLTVDPKPWDDVSVPAAASPLASNVTDTSFTANVQNAPVGAQLEWRLGTTGAWQDGSVVGTGGTGSLNFTDLTPASGYRVYVRAKADANHNEGSAVLLDTVYTTAAKPAAVSDVVHIEYDSERLVFNVGVTPANYIVTIGGVVFNNQDSVSALAEAGDFTISVVRRGNGTTIPDSLPATSTISGRPAAPVADDFTTQKSSSDRSNDGRIIRTVAGNPTAFQYRLHMDGDPYGTAGGWQNSAGTALVAAGSYDVRVRATASSFASKMGQISVEASAYTAVASFTVAQVGGTGGSPNLKTTTALTLTFDRPVYGLNSPDGGTGGLKVTGDTGTVTLGALTQTAANVWTVNLTGVTTSGNIKVEIVDFSYTDAGVTTNYEILTAAQTLAVYKDALAPTAEINYNTDGWKSFLNTVSFGLWYKDTVSVVVRASDGTGPAAGDGVAYVDYYKATAAVSNPATDIATGSWIAVNLTNATSNTGATLFSQAANDKFVVYLKLVDNAGNTSYYEDGVVVFTETALPTGSSGVYVRGSNVNVDITGFTWNGNTVRDVYNTAGTGVSIGSSAWSANYATAANAGKITVNSAYLEGLAAGSYTFRVEYRPFGVTDPAATNSSGDAFGGTAVPTVSYFSIDVQRGSQAPLSIASLSTGGSPDYVYGTAPVTVSAQGGTGTGAYTWESTATDVATVAATTPGASTAVVTILKPGAFTLKVTKAGDADVLAADFTSASSQVGKATPTVAISRTGNTAGVPVTLTATVTGVPSGVAIGSGSGSVAFSYSTDGGSTWSSPLPGGAGASVALTSVAGAGTATATIPAGTLASTSTYVFRAVYTPAGTPDTYYNAGALGVSTPFSPNADAQAAVVISGLSTGGNAAAPNYVYNDIATGVVVSGGSGTGVYTLASNNTSVATVNVLNAAAGTFTVTMVGVGDFTLTAGRQSDGSYNAAAPVTSGTAYAGKAPLHWDTGAGVPAATGITFGQRLSASTLSGVALNSSGTPIAGDVTWGTGVDATVVPGTTDSNLAAYYTYPVVFTPTGVNAQLYQPIASGVATVNVAMGKATLLTIGTPQGSSIYSAASVSPQTLSQSVISGDVYYMSGSTLVRITGTWAWDDTLNTGTTGYTPAASYTFAAPGLYKPWATFTPANSSFFDTLSEEVDLSIYSPITKIDTPPNATAVNYGALLGGSTFSGGKVVAVAAGSTAEEDITSKGTWQWQNPALSVTSQTGTQTATAVFVPYNEVDLSNPSAGGYARATANITLNVTPVAPTVGVVAHAGAGGAPVATDAVTVQATIAGPTGGAGPTGTVNFQMQLNGSGSWVALPATATPGAGSGVAVAANGTATVTIPGGALTAGVNYQFRATYTPSTATPDARLYYTVAEGSTSIALQLAKATQAAVTLAGLGTSYTFGATATITVAGGSGTGVYTLVSTDTSVATVTPVSASAGTFTLTIVKGTGSFALEYGRAESANYEAATTLTSATVTANKATPAWDTGAGAPTATGISYGQFLSASTPTGVVRGVGGADITFSGTVAWAIANPAGTMPGSSDTTGLLSPYNYAVKWTPAGAAADNYLVLDDGKTVAVAVAKAVPYMSTGVRATGSPLFATPPAPGSSNANSLDESSLTGTVYYRLGGVETILAGTWAWDDAANGFAAASKTFPTAGVQSLKAAYTPSDPRVAVYTADGQGSPVRPLATVSVFAPTTTIVTPPTLGSVPYGGTVGNSAITQASGTVNATDANGNNATSIAGTWSWESPTTAITATSGTQSAVLVFTPTNQVDWSNINKVPPGYVTAKQSVALTVAPVAPTVVVEAVGGGTASDPVVLTARITGISGGAVPSGGTVTFTCNRPTAGSALPGGSGLGFNVAITSTGGQGVATVTIPGNALTAQPYTFTATYTPSTSFGLFYTSASGTSASYNVGAGTQAAVVISGLASTYTYGDAPVGSPVALTISGGTGTGAYSLISTDTSVATVSTVNASLGVFTVTIHKAGPFQLTAGRAGDANYNAAASVTSAVVTVGKATPSWSTGVGAPAATAIVYGQRLSASTLSGSAYGVGGATDVIAGTVEFAPSVNTVAFPGSADTGGLVSPYNYPVVFKPSGADADRYVVIDSTVDVVVTPADSFMATGAVPVGTGIFVAGSPLTDTLNDSTLSGEVWYLLDGTTTALTGTWDWDYDNDSVADTPAYLMTVDFPTNGMQQVRAMFTPDDPRVSPYFALADLPVYSPRTQITTPPAPAGVSYGRTLTIADIGPGSTFAIDTSVAEVHAIPAGPGATEDISAVGSWSFKAGTVAINSTTGTQQVVLVFTPDHRVDWTDPTLGGYATAEVTLDITVLPVTPIGVRDLAAQPVVLKYGDPLSSASGLAGAGLNFTAPGNIDVAGSLAWDNPTLVPGSGGALTDEEGNDPKDGTWLAWVTFTPDPAYGSAYTTVSVRLAVAVIANDPALDTDTDREDTLQGALDAIAGVGAGSGSGGGFIGGFGDVVDGRDNYPTAALDAADAAVAAAAAGLAGGGSGPNGALTQAEAETLKAALEAALAALVHDHPVLANTADSVPITAYGTGLTVEVRGAFVTVTGVNVDGTPFVLDYVAATAVAPARIDLYASGSGGAGSGAPVLGTVTEGSAIVTLFPAYIDTLGTNNHTLTVEFADGYGTGSGIAPFDVVRDDSSGSDGSGSGGALARTGDTLLQLALVVILSGAGIALLLFRRFGLERRPRKRRSGGGDHS